MPPLAPQKAARRLTFLDMPPECKIDVLYELCSQFGKVEDVFVPRAQRDAGPDEKIRCYVTFAAVEDAKYCYEALHRGRVKLYNKDLRILHDIPTSNESGLADGAKRKRAVDLHEVGAKLYIKGVNPDVSLFDITSFFEKFGPLAVPIRMLTDKDGNFKGKLMVSFRDFETSDRVIQEMHRAVLFDRLITVEYAELEDGSGDRHGSDVERQNAVLLREERRKYDEQLAAEQHAHNQRLRDQTLTNTAWATRQR
ncbi:RNA-binding protein, putative [Bodo saltans]|uniref:RNA-binding protein, putative n=1 Tax=Bodo saltans TaxID=75058 RepID=A0A0S4IJA0_BODSA|nr:RNA-binding protein, putative [Bodo saltans]|eukprot:CUE77965.1 RNA-binding protein, putative [Bodo saltans]